MAQRIPSEKGKNKLETNPNLKTNKPIPSFGSQNWFFQFQFLIGWKHYAPSLAARKGIAGHYGMGQPNQALFSFRQSFSRGRGKGRRVAPSSAARESRQGRDWVKSKHRGGRGGYPLTLFPTNPVQGMEADGAPGSTMAGVKEGVGTPAARSNNREGKGGTPSQGTRGKILLNGWPPP